MRLVYMDEAGIGDPKREPWLVVAGVIVHGDGPLIAVERHMEELMHKHIPPEHHPGFVFHAKHIFNGDNKVFKRDDPEWPLERRLRMVDDLVAIPRKFNLPIVLGWVERAKFPQGFEAPETWTPADHITGAHVTAFMSAALSVEHWMRRNAENENCLVIVENNDQSRQMISAIQRHNQDKYIELEERHKKHLPLRKIREDPLFQPKRQNNPLCIADLCAYVWKKLLMGDGRIKRFTEPMNECLVRHP